MPKPQPTRHLPVRVFAHVVSWLAASLLVDLGALPTILVTVLGMQALSLMVTAALQANAHTSALRMGLLAVDLVTIAATGFLCLQLTGSSQPEMLAFLAAFVVGTLVSFVGHRPVAGVLGGLAGLMVLGMGLLLITEQGSGPNLEALGPSATWILLGTGLSAVIAGWVTRHENWTRLSQDLERELRAREAEASEMVSLSHALSDSANLEELGEAVLRHLRCHLSVRARAVVIESDGDELALWEEQGRLTTDAIERRRVLVQRGIQRAGSNFVVRRLVGRSLGGLELPDRLDFHTLVDVPVRVGGRVAGVIVLADASRGAVTTERIGTLADVARRLGEALHRIERRRVGENRRTSMLLNEMREGVMFLGLDGKVQITNPSADDVLKCSYALNAEPSLGETSLRDLASTPPGIVRKFQFRLPADEQRPEREFVCTAVSVSDSGKRVGALVTVSDITDEETARRRLMRAEKTTLVGQTLAGVAHELNNPLAALIGYADILKSQEIPERISRAVNRMCEQAIRASKIVRNLLNFARRRNPQRVPIKVRELVESVVELFAYEARINNVELAVDIPNDLPSVLADRHALQQIVVNLTQNAIHALQQEDGDRSITLSARATETEVTLRVRDTGPGIPDELRAQIFQAFFTTKGSTNGTGLGLALSISIARDHGGDLILEPPGEKGACFVLRLPIHQESEDASVPEGQQVPDALPRNVLVVDDEPSVRETLVAQLGNLGARVDSAANSTEAERMLREGRYDAILLDVRMPGTSGLDLHESMRERSPLMAERVVFMTGDFVNDDILTDVLKTGNLLLEKPFSMDELKSVLGRARRARESNTGFTQTL